MNVGTYSMWHCTSQQSAIVVTHPEQCQAERVHESARKTAIELIVPRLPHICVTFSQYCPTVILLRACIDHLVEPALDSIV